MTIDTDEVKASSPEICKEREEGHPELKGLAPRDDGVAERRRVSGGDVSLKEALNREDDMRAELVYPRKLGDFYIEMLNQSEEIQKLVASHFGLIQAEIGRITVADVFDAERKTIWKHGSFNVCIRVSSDGKGPLPAEMAFRVPLPYKIGEATHPGNMEEKVRSEAASYIWISENCADVPIPNLRGFGLPGGLSFFTPNSLSFWLRIKVSVWRFFCRHLRGSLRFSKYIPQYRTNLLKYGYIITDWVESENSRLLSDTFREPHSPEQTRNLYRGMSRVMLSLSKIPQPRIGSWTINDQGQISLSSRPGLLHLYELENLSIPTDIDRKTTYQNTDSFYLDLLSGHDNRLRFHPNATTDEADAQGQATDLVLMRALLHKFTHRHLNNGPFLMQLTDMHISNIFVDSQWNIKHIIDLEGVCSLPVTHLLPPYWLPGKYPNEYDDAAYEQFKEAYNEFVKIFREEEKNMPLHYNSKPFSRTSTMEDALEVGRYLYLLALRTPPGLFNIFRARLQRLFDKVPPDQLSSTVSSFWTISMNQFVAMKLQQRASYEKEVSEIFHSNRSLKLID